MKPENFIAFRLEGTEPKKEIAERARFFKFRVKEIFFGEKTPVSWLFDGFGRRPYSFRVARRDSTSGKPRNSRKVAGSIPDSVIGTFH
jgi:hypothetical protein